MQSLIDRCISGGGGIDRGMKENISAFEISGYNLNPRSLIWLDYGLVVTLVLVVILVSVIILVNKNRFLRMNRS